MKTIRFRMIANDDYDDGETRYLGLTRACEPLWVLDPKEAVVFEEARAEKFIKQATEDDARNGSFYLVPPLAMSAAR